MTPEERALVQYRLDRAHEAIEEAKLLFNAGYLRTYVNRLYYACFYAMSALLLTEGVSTSKHTHLRALLHKDFVRTGGIPVEHGQFFDLLFNSRQKGDYSDLVVFESEQVTGWLQQTEAFVKHVSELISQQS